jgi:TonB family protein
VTTKDPLHIPWAFSLASAERLPLTGEEHPLEYERGKWLLWASALALLLALALFAAWHFYLHASVKAPIERRVHIVHYTDLGVPPSIAKYAPPQINVAQAVAPPSIGVPEPVPDEMAQAPTIATMAEMSESLAPITMSDLGMSGGDSFVVDLDIDTQPSPDEFVSVEEEPVRISIDAPVYPQVASEAGVQGTVIVRVLVGKDGKVKKVIVLDGNPMLNDAAIAAAKTAVFRPALQQHRPVEVWVVMPVTFRLRG